MERKLKVTLVDGVFQDQTPANSARMRAIRATGNRSTEARFRAMLACAGVRGWRIQPKGIIGKPDFYFPEEHLAVFIDGCYWHGCPRCGRVPSVNNPYWSMKLARTKARDAEKTAALEATGLRVLRFWEHELREAPATCLARLQSLINARF